MTKTTSNINLLDKYNSLINITYGFNFRYGLSFLTRDRFNKISNSLSYLRKIKEITGEEYHLLFKIFKFQYDNFYKIKNLEAEEPRIIAQKFIGKKNIRNFIFKRDKFKCLNCNSLFNLTIDHITPISKCGENKISNLQTLCKSCNSKKSDKFKDYR